MDIRYSIWVPGMVNGARSVARARAEISGADGGAAGAGIASVDFPALEMRFYRVRNEKD